VKNGIMLEVKIVACAINCGKNWGEPAVFIGISKFAPAILAFGWQAFNNFVWIGYSFKSVTFVVCCC
jgi:hypothetical protein